MVGSERPSDDRPNEVRPAFLRRADQAVCDEMAAVEAHLGETGFPWAHPLDGAVRDDGRVERKGGLGELIESARELAL